MSSVTEILSERRWTRDELDHLPDDGHRYEIVDGDLVVSAAPAPRHQFIALELAFALRAACPSHLRVGIAPLDVVLASDSVLEPDLLVAGRDAFDDRCLPTRPELAVEVLSPSSRFVDRTLKLRRYERAGTPAYWIVDPDGPTLTAYELRDGAYVQVAEVTGDREWTAQLPFPVTLTPARWAD